jgi:integrase
VFATRTGKPISQSNLLNRDLHPLLEELGLPMFGFHAFRRYRNTWLRKQRTPDALIQFWLGHAGKTMSDLYDRSREDESYRKEVAMLAGIGFAVQKVLESSKVEVEVAAQEPVATLEPAMV